MELGKTLPDDLEVVGAFGNAYLVDDGGEVDMIPRTPTYELAYIHGYPDLAFGREMTTPYVFDVPPRVSVASTAHHLVFVLQIDDRTAVQTPPAKKEEVMRGVIEILDDDTSHTIEHLYEDLLEQQVHVELVNALQERFAIIPPASVQISDEGWIIEDMFLLTWLGKVFLRNRDFERPVYRIRRGVEEVDEDIEFVELDFRGDVETIDLPTGDQVGEKEVEFLSKAYWLTTYRDRYDDDLFWEIIERYVQVPGR